MLRKSLIFIVYPGMSIAHDGRHFHPHGVEPVWALMAVVLALAAGVALGRWRK